MTAAPVDEPWFTRPATDADLNFIRETTLMVRRPHGVPVREWKELHGYETDRILAACQVTVLDGGGVIVGFAAVSPLGLEMLFVKRDMRGNGFGLRLLRESGALDGKEMTMGVCGSTPSFRRWAKYHGLRWRAA